MKRLFLLLSIFCLFYNIAKASDPYNKFTYQGVLTNSDGTIVSDGNYNFIFKIYDDISAGTLKATFTRNSVAVSKGLFSVELDNNNTDLEDLDFVSNAYFLEISANGTTLSPRIEINPVGKSIISRNLKNGTVTGATITGSNIENTTIGTGSTINNVAIGATGASTGKFTSVESGTLKITGGTLAADKVLSSDASGNATWSNALNNITIGATTASTGAFSSLSVGSSKFTVNSTGNITKVNNVTTSFPSSQGAADTYLKNDGSGNLSWASAGGGSSSPDIPEFYGDGTAGALVINSPTDWTVSPPSDKNFQFSSVTINSSLKIPNGLLIKCTGTFTITASGVINVDFGASAGNFGIASGTVSTNLDQLFASRILFPTYGGGSGAGYPLSTSTKNFGGGALVIRSKGNFTNSGTINANGGSATNPQTAGKGIGGPGGGGGGVVIIACDATITAGTINAKGGNGANGWDGNGGDLEVGGGGGGGGIVHFISPSASSVTTTSINVSGGTAGSPACNGTNFMSGTGAVGAGSGGAGGATGVQGSPNTCANFTSPTAGSTGLILKTQVAKPANFFY